MKRSLIAALCLALVMCFGIMSFAGAENITTTAHSYMYVKTNTGVSLNLRANPWKADNNLLGSVPYGTCVLVMGYSGNGTWAYIEAPSGSTTIQGWVSSTYLVKNNPGSYVKPDTTPSTAKSTFESINNAAKALKVLSSPYTTVITTQNATNYVHLRWFPSTEASYSGAYLRNTEIVVLAESSDWAQVMIVEDGKVGFIIKSCVGAKW